LLKAIVRRQKNIFYVMSLDLSIMKNLYIYYIIAVSVGILFAIYFYNTQINRPTFALEVDPTRDTTDISGVMYRVRLTNVGLNELTGIIVDLGGVISRT
jgi:hypothetical protein